MKYLATSQEFLEQSSMLLQAYPETTRTTTKYSYPKPSKKTSSKADSKAQQDETQNVAGSADTSAPVATLTLKTYHPQSGICLKFRTDRAAEVGRLILGLGKLAAGETIESIAATGAAADVEMAEAEAEGDGESDKPAAVEAPSQTTQQQQQPKSKGKNKKSGSKR